METNTLDKHADEQLAQCVTLLQTIFNSDLIGVYLYGSSLVGGLQRFSDLDIFVVTQRPTTHEEKEELAKNLLSISGVYRSTEKRPVEMTIVVQSEITPWHYPPHFDFQYGDWLRNEFSSGNIEPWQTTVNPDLAVVITQVQLASKTLYGEDASTTLPHIPTKDCLSALIDGLDDLQNDLKDDTRNVLLTLARTWMTIETYTIASKQKAAQWTLERLPVNLKLPLEKALLFASDEQEETWEHMEDSISDCATYMIAQIQSDTNNNRAQIEDKKIKLSE